MEARFTCAASKARAALDSTGEWGERGVDERARVVHAGRVAFDTRVLLRTLRASHPYGGMGVSLLPSTRVAACVATRVGTRDSATRVGTRDACWYAGQCYARSGVSAFVLGMTTVSRNMVIARYNCVNVPRSV